MKVIAVDFDGTASDHPDEVNTLFNIPDNLIIIYTARPGYLREQTLKELHELGIHFHCLVMEKLRADIYIDDRNMGGLQWTES